MSSNESLGDSNYCRLASIGEKQNSHQEDFDILSFHEATAIGKKKHGKRKTVKCTNFISPGVTSARGRDSTHKVLRGNAPPSTIGLLPEGSHHCDLTLPAPHKPPIFPSGPFSKMMPWSLPSLIRVHSCTLVCLIIIAC